MTTVWTRTQAVAHARSKPECIGSIRAHCDENKEFTRHFAHWATTPGAPWRRTAKPPGF